MYRLQFSTIIVEKINPRTNGADAVRIAIVIYPSTGDGTGGSSKQIGDMSGNVRTTHTVPLHTPYPLSPWVSDAVAVLDNSLSAPPLAPMRI